jgi:plasmid stabilization system protein ParE
MWSYPKAEEYVFGLIDYLSDLKTHLFMAKTLDHIRDGYLRLPYQKHHIFFTINDDGTYNIIRILHQHMDSTRHLK